MLNISTLLIVLMGIGGCTDDAVKKSETAELTKDEYLDSLVKNNSSYSPVLMIDSTIVTGSMGFRFADTLIFGVSDLARTKDPFVLCRIGAIEPLSPDYDKVAVYTKVERFISFRAAVCQFLIRDAHEAQPILLEFGSTNVFVKPIFIRCFTRFEDIYVIIWIKILVKIISISSNVSGIIIKTLIGG